MEKKVKIVSVNISEKKGTIKKPVDFIELSEIGISQDSHPGKSNRQVSMLGMDSIEKFSRQANRSVNPGEFTENITVKGMKVYKTAPFDHFYNDKVDLEVTQIGKRVHGKSGNNYNETGDNVMSKEGIFLRVKKGGILKVGDQLIYKPYTCKIRIITVSDRASAGIYEDESGPALVHMTEDFFKKNNRLASIDRKIIPDDREIIEQTVTHSVNQHYDIIFTTGGTGIGPRDNTPDVIRSLLDKEIPGIMELIRVKYGMDKPNALLSRSIAGLIGNSLVYALPGSRKAVEEYGQEIFKTLNHSMLMLHGINDH